MSFINETSIKETCLAPIDVQGLFVDPSYLSIYKFFQPWIATDRTKNTASKIGVITPQFNQVGIDIAWIYYTDSYNSKRPFNFSGKMYNVSPHENDAIIQKIESSAFDEKETPFEKWLINNKKNHIVMCGFYLTACVYWTAVHAALKGYKVTVLADLSVDGRIRGQDEQTHKQCLDEFTDIIQRSPPCISNNIQLATSETTLTSYKQHKLVAA